MEKIVKQFDISPSDKPVILKQIIKLNKTADKLGINAELTIEFGKIYRARVSSETEFEVFEDLLPVKISSYPIKLGDWSFLATIEHTPNGNIIRTVPNYESSIPEKYRTSDTVCDHCKTIRDRKDTYLVFNSATEEMKQVGKTCLKDFTGHDLPKPFYDKWLKMMDSDEDKVFGNEPRITYYSLEQYIAFTLWAINVMDRQITKELARWIPEIYNVPKALEDFRKEYANNIDKAKKFSEFREDAKLAISWVANDMKAYNDFLINIQILAKNSSMQDRDSVLAVYIAKVYLQHLDQLKTAEIDNSKYVGSVGDKIEFSGKVANVISLQPMAFGYGNDVNRYANIFIDENENLYVWYTSTKMEENAEVSVKATVKDHKEYRGKKQTIITRAKTTPKAIKVKDIIE